ncbi:thiol reductant ABC exporter subunit CydD [Pseudoxanthomonas sp. LH2527]|uniref:thiol reductant ABC exporter subunit CydD n=1 Tax=Pseudoxanthomonas sp. LH2527 TaxID=2923249 RepID=UPI001F1478B3|nr:thiol reductant ABC exporter subunit CydD [Pseudoxanthomonas sp. LH2527]MCH6483860.1 thiol reductant ABC exporter subunit CydD [Pseudoxanthomonas sp. LH2527]
MSGDASDAPTRATAKTRLQALGDVARKPLRAASALGVIGGVLVLPQAALIALCLQRAFVDGEPPVTLLPLLGALLATLLLRAGLGWASRRLADRAVERIRIDLRARIARGLVARGPVWVRSQQSGALAERMGAHVDALEGYFGGFVPLRAEIVGVPLAILLAAFVVDRTVGLVLLLTMPLVPAFMMLVGWGAQAASQRQLQALTRMGGHFADRLRGLGLIRLYGRGASELAGIRAAAEELRVRSLRVLRIAFLSSAVLEFFASLSVAMIALYLGLTYLGMLDLRAAPLTLGMGVFCLLLAPEFYAPLRRLATHYHDRAAALAAMDEIALVLDVDEPALSTGDGTQASGTSLVSAHAVALRHPAAARDVLHDITLQLQRGQHVALVGASGEGKSTLLEALAGWLPVHAGGLQRAPGLRIGYAPQRPFLFAGSLRDNLRMARPDASEAELEQAAEAAQVMRFASRLPDGLDTVIGERGFGLSGGEARRVALARVFLRDPDLLLLDEPTAFLDADTEAAVLRAIRQFAQGRAVVLATHSPAAQAAMAQVWQVRDGRVHVDGGTP